MKKTKIFLSSVFKRDMNPYLQKKKGGGKAQVVLPRTRKQHETL